jgi:hypothetical protein
VLVGLFVMMGGAAHYGALYLSHKRHRDFVDRYIKHARQMAWGDSLGIAGIPGANGSNGNISAGATGFENAAQQDEMQAQTWNRRQKRMAEKESRKSGKNPKAASKAKKEGISTPVEAELTSGPVGAKKRVVAENGKVLIVDSIGNVYVEEANEEGETLELLLDVSPHPVTPQTLLTISTRSTPLNNQQSTTQSSLSYPPGLTTDPSAASLVSMSSLCLKTRLNPRSMRRMKRLMRRRR